MYSNSRNLIHCLMGLVVLKLVNTCVLFHVNASGLSKCVVTHATYLAILESQTCLIMFTELTSVNCGNRSYIRFFYIREARANPNLLLSINHLKDRPKLSMLPGGFQSHLVVITFWKRTTTIAWLRHIFFSASKLYHFYVIKFSDIVLIFYYTQAATVHC
jgi:hypothetical protein